MIPFVRERAVMAVTAVLCAIGLTIVLAAPAEAAIKRSYSVTDNPGGNDGAGRAKGKVTFVDANHVKWKRSIKDICPADKKNVTSKLQVYADRKLARDKFINAQWGVEGCGNTAKDKGKIGYSAADNVEIGTVWRVRFSARVGKGRATWTRWLDNPYSNDPSRSGA